MPTTQAAPGKSVKFPIQLLDLDAITVDHAIQSRVATNIEYQREFSEAMLRGDSFPPITVFFDGTDCWLADGFHRYGATKQASRVDRKFLAIRAEVRPGTREDAIVFSAGANQKFSIPRTKEDIKKSVWMLLDDLRWRNSTITDISRHVGCSQSISKRYWVYYFEERKIEAPEIVVGRQSIRRVRFPNHPMSEIEVKAERRSIVRAAAYRIAKDKDLADLAERNKNLEWKVLDHKFLARGCIFRPIDSGITNVCAWFGHGCLVLSLFHDDGLSTDYSSIVGNILLSRVFREPDARAVIVCYPEDANHSILDLGRKLGIEFLTPDELVASIKAAEKTH